jgi:initiation factor 1A
MPNTRGGSSYKKKKKGQGFKKPEPLLLEKDCPGCLYAMVTKKNGTSFEILCSNEKTERAIIRGKFRKRVWININDIVLVETNELGLFIIIHKYSQDDVRQLRSKGEINFTTLNDSDDENNIFFEDENISDDEDNILKELDKLKKDNDFNIDDI